MGFAHKQRNLKSVICLNRQRATAPVSCCMHSFLGCLALPVSLPHSLSLWLLAFAAAEHKINKFIYLHSQRRPAHTKTQWDKVPKETTRQWEQPKEGDEWEGNGNGNVKANCYKNVRHTHTHTHAERSTHWVEMATTNTRRILIIELLVFMANTQIEFRRTLSFSAFCLSLSLVSSLLSVYPCDWAIFLRAPTRKQLQIRKLSTYLRIDRSKYVSTENRTHEIR